MKVRFEMEKATKNTIRFAEVLDSELAAPKVGSIYIPKSTLGQLKWDGKSAITIEIEPEGVTE